MTRERIMELVLRDEIRHNPLLFKFETKMTEEEYDTWVESINSSADDSDLYEKIFTIGLLNKKININREYLDIKEELKSKEMLYKAKNNYDGRNINGTGS